MKKTRILFLMLALIFIFTINVSTNGTEEHVHTDCCNSTVSYGENTIVPLATCYLGHWFTSTYETSVLEWISGNSYWCIHYTVTQCDYCLQILSMVEYDRHIV